MQAPRKAPSIVLFVACFFLQAFCTTETGAFSINQDEAKYNPYIPATPKHDILRVPKPTGTGNATNTVASAGVYEGAENIIELLIVCDKPWGDLFNHDRRRILDYWTVFMWDVNMRYKTIEGVKLSFQTVGVFVADSEAAQGFIEEAKIDGKVEHGRILNTFPKWAVENAGILPKYDMVAIATATPHEWGGGLAYIGAVCNYPTYNIASFGDDGTLATVSMASHEMGHNMGGDHDDDPNGACGGNIYNGYIMDGSDEDRRFFFSGCSNRDITNTVNSPDRDCLRRKDEPSRMDLPPDYNSPLAPTLDDQCKLRARDQGARFEATSSNTCKRATCVKSDGGRFDMEPLDNSPCDNNARCFRGNCRQQGQIFRNSGSGLCLRYKNPYNFEDTFELFKCPAYASPLDRLVVRSGVTGFTLAGAFEHGDKTKETGDTCMWTGITEDELVLTWADRCGDYTNPWHGWEFRDVGNGEFLLVHKETGRCARPFDRSEGSDLVADKTCDSNNQDMRWARSD